MIQHWVTVTGRPPTATVPPSSFHRSFIWGHSPSCLLPSHHRFLSLSFTAYHFLSTFTLPSSSSSLSLHPTLLFLFCFFTSFFPSHSSPSLRLNRHATQLTFWLVGKTNLSRQSSQSRASPRKLSAKRNKVHVFFFFFFYFLCVKNIAVGVKFSWSFSCSPCCPPSFEESRIHSLWWYFWAWCGQAESIAAAHVKAALGGRVNEQQSASHQS